MLPRGSHRQRDDQRQPEAQQCLQGLARGRVRLDRDGGQQRLDAARLHRAPARGLARGYRRRQLAARDGFWAELECAFLNTYQLRWQYTSAAIGLGFAQGKSMLYRRSQIEKAGGIRLLAAEAAEDAATTKVVR